MSPDVIRWIIALAVLGHGVGHVLFMPVLAAPMKLEASGHSWLLTGVLGDGATRLIASFFGAVLVAAFTVIAGGVLLQTAWWRPLGVAAAVASMALVILLWDGLPTGPASAALLFDAAILVALIVFRWPSSDLIGA